MPAFDPVRDAVLNSPVSSAHPLPARMHLELPQNVAAAGEQTAATASPVTRRATDLSVLLNDDPPPALQSAALDTPLFTPTTPRAPSGLSHLLLSSDSGPDLDRDELSSAPPLTRKAEPDRPPSGDRPPPQPTTSYFTHRGSSSQPLEHRPELKSSPIALSFPSRVSPGTTSVSVSPTASTSSRTSAAQKPPPPPPAQSRSPPKMPPPAVPTTHALPPKPPPPSPAPQQTQYRSTRPYAPRRITPAGSVLVPLSSAEMERYKNWKGAPATMILRKKGRTDGQDGPKRLREDDGGEEEERRKKRRGGDVGIVVEHYNARPEVGVTQRKDSPIIGLKNFNNWVKSVIIAKFGHPALMHSGGGRGKVLDMGCGKGGDLTKWAKAKVRDLVGLDIADVSVEQAQARHASLRGPRFTATFRALDCYVHPLPAVLPPALLEVPFDVVSLQFCMHYAFESEAKARMMLENVSTWMRKGGVFIGTVPNDALLFSQLDALPPDAEELSFGNSVYQIRFEDRKERPIYGHRYWFYLKDAVDDVPEYVVRWDNFVKLAAEYGLHQKYKKEFHEVFQEHQEHPEFGPLLERMRVVDSNGESQMDEDQWEAANIYVAFAFEKR